VKVLVTGGRGFLGAHVCDALRAEGHEAVALGRADGDLAEAGVADRRVDEHEPDAVVHLAAVMPGDERLVQNAPITELVARACAQRGIRLLLGSTVSVYTDDTPYAESKRASEEAAPDATILRLSFPYGPGQRRGAIPTMLQQARSSEPIVVYRTWRRSFCHAADEARAVVLLLERGERGIWDIGRDDDSRTLLEVAQIACRLAGAPESLIEEVDPPAGIDAAGLRLDVERLHSLGWRPEIGLEDGMQQTLDWLASPRT
jgi:nucleoside-diphosphate-sugar epimerase